MTAPMKTSGSRVHCRIGSLESAADVIGNLEKVHCRIGSLENDAIEL